MPDGQQTTFSKVGHASICGIYWGQVPTGVACLFWHSGVPHRVDGRGVFGTFTQVEKLKSYICYMETEGRRKSLFTTGFSGQDVGMYVIRDAAYPLTTWPMRHFPDTGILTPQGCFQPQDKQSTGCDWKCIGYLKEDGVAYRNRTTAFLREWGLCWSYAACVLIFVRAMEKSINGNRLNPTLFLSRIWPYRPLQRLK